MKHPRRHHLYPSCRDTTSNRDRSFPFRVLLQRHFRQTDSSTYQSTRAPPICPPVMMEIVQTKDKTLQQHPATPHPTPTSLDSLFERFCCKAVEIPCNFTVGDGNLTRQLTIAGHPEATNINKAEITSIQTQHHDIGGGSYIKVTQLFAVNHFCRSPCCARNDFVERHSEVEKLRHDVEHVLHALVHTSCVKVSTDRIRSESLLNGWDGDLVGETSATVANVKDDSALLSFEDKRFEFAILNDGHSSLHIREAVREDVAGTQLFHKQRLQRKWRIASTEVDHHRDTRKLAGFNSAFGRNPGVTLEVGEFNADNVFFVFLCHLGCHDRVHVFDVLFALASAHAVPNNVEE